MAETHRADINDLITAVAENMSAADLLETVVCMETGDAIRSARKRQGLSQKEFAEKMGVTQGLVSRWESGNCNYTVKTLVQIAAALGLDMVCPLARDESAATPKRAASLRVVGASDTALPYAKQG